MIDTLKLAIPLTEQQHQKFLAATQDSERWQWVLHHPKTGDIRQRRLEGLAHVDGESFHRELRWFISPTWDKDAKLILELSLPKYWIGHNVHLVYDIKTVLNHLKQELEQQFELKRDQLIPVEHWEPWRVDPCYAWRMPTQDICHLYLNSLKTLSFPHKKPVIHESSIFFKGRTYSFKLYEKYPEFRNHDLRELIKNEVPLEYINDLEDKARGVLRVEATLRKQYLKYYKINTVGDLLKSVYRITPDQELVNSAGKNLDSEIEFLRDKYYSEANLEDLQPQEIQNHFETPRTIKHDPGTISIDGLGNQYVHSVGSITIQTLTTPLMIVEIMLDKFLGSNRQMQEVDQVRAELLKIYKPNKTAHLIGMWLYVRRFGASEAKAAYGRDSYYYAKREMKKAGVGFLELPDNVKPIDRNFVDSMRLEVPSKYVTNIVDDDRDGDNVINLQHRALTGA